jgi:hypothetical protein
MSEYAKKTCNQCGLRDIQPNMVRATKKVKTGSSRSKLSAGTYVGLLIENKTAQKRFRNNLWANNKRQYTRYREVWMCKDCAKSNPAKSDVELGPLGEFLCAVIGGPIALFVVLFGVWFFLKILYWIF